nr:hypothetical protein [Tanacetum cinerariifolium]
MSTDKESSIAGTYNRPPMLVESDYKSWKICIERYICGKPLGKLIWRSIQNGPTLHPQFTVIEGQGAAAVQVTRDKTDEEFTKIENNRDLADIQETNILSQGLPRHVFNILNQTRTGKEIWDNVELLMKGSGKSLKQKKKELFDKYEPFRAIGNKSIHDYFVHFHKLINDMKITQLDIPAHQMNTNFVNNLPPYWAKYVTNVKNNKDISAATYVELYTYLQSYEPHDLKTLKKQEQSSSIVDPLAYLASTTHHLTPTQPTNPPPSISSLTLPPQPADQSRNDVMLATMNQIVNSLSSFKKKFPLTNNQLRTSSNSMSHATVHDGQIVTETVQRKAPGNVGNIGTRGTQSYGKEKQRVKDFQYFKDKMLLIEAKEKGAVLDTEAKAFLADVECTAPYDQPLAIMTTNNFEVSHEDAYDSDVDEGPHAAAAFMANLSSTSRTNGVTTSHVNEVHIDNNQLFNNVNHLLAHEMHQEEQLDSDVESDIDENTITYHQYQLDSEVQNVPTEVSSVSLVEMSRDVLTVGSTMRIPLLYRGEYSQWVERFMNYLEEQTDGEAMINSIKNGLPNDIYSLIDNNKTAKDLWDVLARNMLGFEHVINDLKKCGYSKDNCELNFKFLNNLQPEWNHYATMMRQNKNLMDINIDALYNILKKNQGDVNDAMRSKKKTVVVTFDPLALIAEKTNKDKDEQVLLAEDQAWIESSNDSDQEINANMVFMAQIEKVLSDSEASSLSADEKIFENRVEKANQQSKDFENQNKDLQNKYNVLKNQTTDFEMNNKELNEQLKELIEKNNDLLAQTKVLKDQLQVKHVIIDTHVECQEKYAKLVAERYEYTIRYSAYFDNDKQHRKQIADQQVLCDKMSVQLVELDKHVRDLKNTVDSDQEINANIAFMAQIEKVLSDLEASSSSANEKISK